MAAGSDAMATMIANSLSGLEIAPVAEAPVPAALVSEPPAIIPAQETSESAPVPAETPIEVEEPDTPEQLLGGILDPNSTRGQKIWSSYKFMKDLVKPESEGGIGHEPTVEDIKAYHGNHSTLNQMMTDFESQPGVFIQAMTNVNPEATAQMITELPKVLDQMAASNPHMAKAQEELYTQVNNATVDGLVDLAKSSTGEMQKFYFGLARQLKYFISGGKVELKDTILAEPIDPLANERKQLQEREQRLSRIEQEREQRILGGFRQELFTGLTGKLEDAFGWPKELSNEFWFKPVAEQTMTQVRQAVGASTIARSELDSMMAQMQRQLKAGQNVSQLAQQFQATYLKYARPHIARVRAEIIQKTGRQAPKSAPVATSVAPAQAGTVSTSSPSMSMPKKDTQQSFEDFAAKHLSTILGVQ